MKTISDMADSLPYSTGDRIEDLGGGIWVVNAVLVMGKDLDMRTKILYEIASHGDRQWISPQEAELYFDKV